MSRWDAILASAPLNAEAATVTSEGWESDFRAERDEDPYEQITPHELRPFVKNPENRDLKGSRFGRVTVLGLMKVSKKRGKGALWSVRCDCGIYTGMRTKSLNRKDREEPLACRNCDYLEGIKRGHSRAAIDNSGKTYKGGAGT